MMPLLMTTLMAVVPEHDRGRVMGNVTLAMSVAPALGPAVSGRDPAVAVVALDLPARAADRRRHRLARAAPAANVGEPAPAPSTGSSVVIAALGFGSLVYGLSEVGARRQPLARRTSRWSSVSSASRASSGASCCSSATDRPLLDLRTLRHRVFAVSLARCRSRSWRCSAR